MAVNEFRPKWCPHVVGRFDDLSRDSETGMPEPVLVKMECEQCGATHQMKCATGMPRQWVLRFATVHVHRDVMAIPKKE